MGALNRVWLKRSLLVIKNTWLSRLEESSVWKKFQKQFVSLKLSNAFFSKKLLQLCFGLGFRFRPFRYKLLLVNNSNFQSWIIINSKYRPKRGMNRFAVLNCVTRAELVSPALNRLLPRFEQKMAKIPKNKLNKSFSIF